MTSHPAELLAADTTMGMVTLLVADLDVMTAYYRDAVTLDVIDATGGTVTLGRRSIPLVVLQHEPGLVHASPREAGLFHTAILFPTRAELAAAVFSVASAAPGTFTGSADHLVSQAFYFTDPEGNGIELYWDRDRSAWSWVHGQIEMATLSLDPNAFILEHHRPDDAAATSGDAAIGHVHLSVGDVATAREFYVRRLGFAETVAFGNSALFVSAGGYHHHMAMNTWNSAGAGRRKHTLGLGVVEIVVPTREDLGALGERMNDHGVVVRDDGRTLSLDDPWANLIRVTAAR